MSIRLITIGILLSCSAVTGTNLRTERLPPEYKIKLAFLYKFAEYVQIAEPIAEDKIYIGVFGKNPFGKALDLIAAKRPQGRICVPLELKTLDDLDKADIIFISRHVADSVVEECLQRTRTRTSLVVGENAQFLERGGVANFSIGTDGRVKIQVNPNELRRRNLVVDARLLSICDRILR